jgi:hypothetical protein
MHRHLPLEAQVAGDGMMLRSCTDRKACRRRERTIVRPSPHTTLFIAGNLRTAC